MKIQPFIFNWKTTLEGTKTKERQFKELGFNPIIINSDETNEDPSWVNIGETAYFNKQVIVSIEEFLKTDADVFFHIQGDASYSDWTSMINDSEKYFQKYNWGIYAPNLDYTWYDSSRTDVDGIRFEEDNLRFVACTDCNCWMVHRDIIEMYQKSNIDMNSYVFGWGWDIIFPSFCYLNRRPVIRDYNHTIYHPTGTNYNKDKAEMEMLDLYNNLTGDMKIMFYLIKQDRHKLQLFYANK